MSNMSGVTNAVSTNSSETRQQASPSPNLQAVKKTPNDFYFGKILGEGSFSVVYLARDVNSERQYAIKVCEKRHILREKKQQYIKREKEVLSRLNAHSSPFFIKLYCTFQDTDSLYFVLSYAKHGELLPYIQRVGSFDEPTTQFYSGEIILALEHLHGIGIIHRDLKPENILLDENMHIKITDFGSAKILDTAPTTTTTTTSTTSPSANPGERNANSGPPTPRRHSFVGTAQYVSPELLNNKSCSKSSDLWALGCIIYQFLSGLPPFRGSNEWLIFQKVVKNEFEFPEGFSVQGTDLVNNLIVLDPLKRLGSDETGGYAALKAHPFYKGLKWENLHEQTPPKIMPYLPATSSNEELRSEYEMPDHMLEPGLDSRQLTRLLGLGLEDNVRPPGITDISSDERARRLAEQQSNPFHKFCEGHLILKQGILDKRVGLFARRRMFLLTEGPHLYYVDPNAMVLKGQIPWSADLRTEPKNFKIFFVHTPNRTYYLIDPEGYALEWCKIIEAVRAECYDKKKT